MIASPWSWPSSSTARYSASLLAKSWQIDAFWRFQIPEEMRKKYGYPELTIDAKKKILGLNSARLYGIKEVSVPKYKAVPKDYEKRMPDELKKTMEMPGYAADNLTKIRETYASLGFEPSNTRYGWIR